MKKNFLQDIIPPSQKRSIRDIPLPNHKKTNGTTEERPIPKPAENTSSQGDIKIKRRPAIDTPEDNHETVVEEPKKIPPQDIDNNSYYFEDEKRRDWKIGKILIISAIVLIVSGILFMSRTHATISVWPVDEELFVQESYPIANIEDTESDEVIAYKLLPIKKEANIKVEPSGEEEVSQKASGQIKIVNEYSSEPQTLVKNTRFQTKKGLVYRISESVKVPGYTKNGDQIVPGELNVEVVADEPGDKYNISKTDFTIPGFEGLPQFETMYAQGLSDMSGGFVGKKKIVSEQDKESGLVDLKSNIKSQIDAEIGNFSDEFLIFYTPENIQYSKLTENDLEDGVELKIAGEVKAYVFEIAEIARYIAQKNIPNSAKGEITIKNTDEIDFEIVNSTISEENTNNLELSINGNVHLVWLIDAEDLKNKISGTNRNDFVSNIKEFSNISKAEIDLSPFWKNKLPKASKINVEIEDYID